MRFLGLFAIALMGTTTAAHYFGGGPEFYEPLRTSEISAQLITGFSVIWHAITLLLLLMTAALISLHRKPNPQLYWFLFTMQIGFGALFITYGLHDLGNITELPQWIAFWGTAILMLLAKYTPYKQK